MSDRVSRLHLAKRIILEVRETLSNETTSCECCGMIRYLDWDDHQMRDLLNGVVNRLEKVCDRLEERGEP